MKLHLPKQLFTALLAAITLAAPATLSLGSSAWGTEVFDSITKGGDFYAGSYSFSFVLDDAATNGSVVAAFWGNDQGTNALGSNAFTVEVQDDGTYKLYVGRGQLDSININGSTTFDKTVSDASGAVFTTTLQAGVLYTITGGSTGGEGNATATIDSAYMEAETCDGYNGNMNGSTLSSGVNSAYAVSGGSNAVVWKATSDGASATNTDNWQTIINKNPAAIGDTSVLVFEAVNDLSKSVDVTGLNTVRSIKVYDDYTFSATAATTLTTTSGLTIASGKTLTLAGADISGAGITTVSGIISGAGALKKTGTGTTTLSGANTYTGGTTIEGGTLALDEAGTFGNGGVTVNSGAFVEFRGSQNKTISNIISGDGGVKQTGTGTTTLSGENTYTGGTTIEGGTLKVTNASALGSNKTVNITAGTLDVATTGNNHDTLAGADITMGAGAILKNSGGNLWADKNQISSLTLDGDATINAASRFGLVSLNDSNYNADGTSLNLNGHTLTISGGGGFVLVDTTISNGGKISISSGSKMLLGHMGYGTSVSASGTTVELNGGTLMLEKDDTSMTLAGLSGASGTLDNLGTVNLTGAGTYSFGATVNQTTGTIDIQAGTHTYTGSSIDNTVKISAAGAKLILDSESSQTINGAISGAGTLQKDGAGTATVARVENMSGGLTVNGGALNVTALSDMSGGLTVNEGSLTVTTLSGACDFVKNGTGTATLTTVNNITGGFTVSAGELSIGTFNVDTTLNLTVAEGATLTLGTVVVNAQNNLNLAEGITATRKYTTDTTNLTESTNGYLVDNATYVLFNGYAWKNGSVAGYTVDTTTDSTKTLLVSSGLSSHMMYYVNSDTENYASNSVIASDATKGIVLKEGTTLNMSTSLNTNATVIEVDGASDDTSNSVTINLAADTVTLRKNQLSINSGAVTLTGSGIYDLGSVTDLGQTNNTFADYLGAVTVGSAWTGTIKLSGTAKGVYLNHKGSNSSWLQLDGLTGWFGADAYSTGIHTANLDLTDYGLIVDDNSNRLYRHEGAIKGTGNYTIQTLSNNTPSYEFIGDLSKWEGAFVVKQHETSSNKPNVTLNLTNGGTLYSGAETSGIRMEREGTLTVNIGNSTEGTTTMRGVITNLDEEGTAHGSIDLNVKGSTAFTQNVTVTSMTVDAGKTATVNATLSAGTVNLGSNATVTAGTMTGVKLADSGITAVTNDTKGSISAASVEIAQLAEDASFTIEDMTLLNTTITAATTTEVKLNNVTATNTMLADGNYTLSGLNATVGTPEVGNVSISYSTGLGVDSGATLTLNLDVLGAVEQHGSGVYDITITLDGFGADYEFTEGALAGLVKFDADSWLGEVIGNVTPEVSIVDEQQVATLSDNVGAAATPSVSYTATPSVGTLVITISGLNVPEPATSTLSLLALAALAARRRRND